MKKHLRSCSGVILTVVGVALLSGCGSSSAANAAKGGIDGGYDATRAGADGGRAPSHGSGGASGGGGRAASGGGNNGGAKASGGSSASGGAGNPDAGPIVAPEPLSANIVVDQFGYRSSAEKIAVIRSPVKGFDSGASFAPGAKFALVDAHSDSKVFEAAPAPWNNGATDDSSGDKAWWFDFSSVTIAGDYYILDETKKVRSDVFAIADGVYRDILTQATRMLFFQRDGFAKAAPFVDASYADGAAHMGKCYLYSDGGKTLNRDLHGGWWDAGNFNKYTNWAASYVVELLHAYVDTNSAFTDQTNIAESGNGIPDLLDEVKWELDWLVRMQNTDGSVLSIVDEPSAKAPTQGGSPDTSPSKVTDPCKYGPATTTASLSTAAAFAYAAVVLKSVGPFATKYPGFTDDLLGRAKQAYAWAGANPATFFYNSENGVGAGEQEVPHAEPAHTDTLTEKHLMAALYLFEATSDPSYRNYFDANYASMNVVKTSYADGFHGEDQETLLEYTLAKGATVAVTQKIKDVFVAALASSANLGAVKSNPDPYLAYLKDYTWGSNQVKADVGNLLYDSITFGIGAGDAATAERAAERYVHYLHGVNPLQMVYLSNMGDFGAQKSPTRFYHSWFAKGSNWDAVSVSKYSPPPGYLTGGPNPSYNWDGCCPGGCSGNSCGAAPPTPPTGQPAQKSYLDFNDNWPLDSWEVTEPSDGYQVKYIRLLSKFAK